MPTEWAWLEHVSVIAVLGWMIYSMLSGKLVAGRHYDAKEAECKTLRDLLPKQTALLERILFCIDGGKER